MSWPFGKPKGVVRAREKKVVDNEGRRILGFTFEGKAILEPNTSASSITYAAAGGGKTTGIAIPTVQALLASTSCGLVINDVKSEIAMQIADMCIKYGRKFGVIDPFHVLGKDYPYQLSVNLLSTIVEAARSGDPDLPFYIESFVHTVIPEPKGAENGSDRNFFWREMPRQYLSTALRKLLAYPEIATPGGLADLVGNPELFAASMKMLAEDGDMPLSGRAAQILETRDHNPQLYSQHLTSAQSALNIFAEGPLHGFGTDADASFEELLSESYIICVVMPGQHAERLGSAIALTFNAMTDLQMTGRVGRTVFLIDEACAGPFEPALRRITIMCCIGGVLVTICQSRKDLIRKYGEEFTVILEENSLVKHYLKITQYDEAERLSKAIGESLMLQEGLSIDHKDPSKMSGTLGLGRQRHWSAAELMALPEGTQILHIAGIGYIHCLTPKQNWLGPYCYDLGFNEFEGGILPPDPKITLKTPEVV
ncbi:type IV secretory system conjugative DNA transfer family protein [Coralliovum pocilloporae]|uniref:type IV secretory system conjugative DNA transfer family protein n=1 Tax=Coralliovum pocilloporae TaxID=3066369 RepID=UPI003307B966